ncbi:MAG: diguanylate cyclase [Acidobacteriota bacterium]|jgi:diguanylate cyclase (GGDEF)-like protein/PAS domain S-box-containing protein|nr:diguanylate cyclase [Acidobacteriota bacterium]NLT33267.1 diguanylate cyclase [Acidobacteriota bacterium]
MEQEGRTDGELEALWGKLEELKRLEPEIDFGLEPEPPVPATAPGGEAARIRAEIEERVGFLPPCFIPALGFPDILEDLWRRYRAGVCDSPLPELFREKLLLRLARATASPYFVVTHACSLRELGVSARAVRELLELPEPDTGEIERALSALAGLEHPLCAWPGDTPGFEEGVSTLALALFLGIPGAERATAGLKDLLGDSWYLPLMLLLSSARGAHMWMEAHPEIGSESHPAVRAHFLPLVNQEPLLLEIFHNPAEYFRRAGNGEKKEREGLYREMFENASDIIYTHDFEGRIRSINRAIERIAGYTRPEALEMNISDLLTPEFAHLVETLTDPQVAGEIPLNYELEISAKDGGRIILEVSTRPLFREGKAVAVQGIARDVTARKRAEAQLHEANQKLEAWVGELEQRTREMAMLNEMGDILRACLTTEEAYGAIVRVAQQIFPAKVGALYIISPARDSVEAKAVWGDPSLAESSFPPAECWALRRGRTHWVEHAGSGLVCRHVHHPAPAGYMCIPMMAQSEALGMLHLMHPDSMKMTESRQRLAVTMSEHIAMALSNLRLHETLRSQSIRDPLTGLFNRRFMEESLELEMRRAARNQRPLGMIMMDLDHFKYFNDTFGHEAGDLLLKELGKLLRSNIRGEDIACRYGGEEFTLILPEGNSAVTRQRAEFFKEAIQRLDVHYRGIPLGRVTASMGVAVFPDHGRTAQELVEAADKALYHSKNAGRDRVTLAE